MSNDHGIKIIGVGSPIVDLLARVDDAFIDEIDGAKGGMELVTPAEMDALLEKIDSEIVHAPGGSAGNTLFALAKMGLPGAMLGMLGSDDHGNFYVDTFKQYGGDHSRFKPHHEAPTARCLSLITPDGQRTMRTDLGAAALLSADEVTPDDFEGHHHAHIEGYLLLNRDLAWSVLKAAKEAGCTVSLDLGSFEVVHAAKDILPEVLENYVDAVFANEDEAHAYWNTRDWEQALEMFSDLCDVTAVKLGAEGALIKRGGDRVQVPALLAEEVLDTTGAGDFWAAGFLYGFLLGHELEHCGHLGALLGHEVVQCIGTGLQDDSWKRIADHIEELSAKLERL